MTTPQRPATLAHTYLSNAKASRRAAKRRRPWPRPPPARRLLEQIERSSRNAEEPVGEFGDEAMSQLKAECAKLYSEVLRLMDGGDARRGRGRDEGFISGSPPARPAEQGMCFVLLARAAREVLTRLRCEAG